MTVVQTSGLCDMGKWDQSPGGLAFLVATRVTAASVDHAEVYWSGPGMSVFSRSLGSNESSPMTIGHPLMNWRKSFSIRVPRLTLKRAVWRRAASLMSATRRIVSVAELLTHHM